MRRSSRVRVNTGLALAMLLVAAAGVLAIVSTNRAFRIADQVTLSQESLRRLSALLASLEFTETAQRGYIITGTASYRADVERGRQVVGADLDSLRHALGANAVRRPQLAKVETLVQRRLDLLARTTAAFERHGLDSASALVRRGEGAAVMDTLRQQILAMERAERNLLQNRNAQSLVTEETTRNLLLLTVVMGILVLGAAVALVNRELVRRARNEEQLQAAIQAADAASRAKSEFLATVSHEIRTPLNAVLGMTELLRDTQLSSEQHEFTRTVHSNAEALVALVGDLLDSFKIEAGQVDIETLPFDPREVVESVGEILTVRAEARDLDLCVAVLPDVPAVLLGDGNRLRQILMNLVGNAIKFTEHGEVTVTACVRTRATEMPALEIVVEDTGIGIPRDALERIFEPFVQAEASTTRRFGGTGLGLNIARSLTQLMGGTITVESEVGKGSRFTLRVPLRVDQDAIPTPRPDLAGVRVLAVSANEHRRDRLSQQLRAAGALVTLASDEVEAAEAIRSSRPAVILVDDRVTDPCTYAPELRRVAGGARVIALCRLSSTIVGQQHADIFDYLFKPLRERRLLDSVSRAAGRGSVTEHDALDIPARPSRARQQGRILVAEDNADNWLLAARVLRSGGYGVDLAEDGRRAVEMASEYAYDLILMDVEMPEMDGLEATRQIRLLEKVRHREATPVIALTAHALSGFRERCLDAGMDDYATKPVTPRHLLELAEQWIDPRFVIAIADDAPENHVLIRHFLRGEPFRFVSAHDGHQALELVQHQRVSVMLLDMDMPGMDGYQAVREMRRNPMLADLPVLAITGYTGADERAKCFAAGCTGYVAKPIRRGELLTALRGALDGAAPHRTPVSHMRAQAAPRNGAQPETTPPRAPVLRERVSAITRMLERTDLGAALPIAREVASELLSARRHRASRFARELEQSLVAGDERSAVFWASRLTGALREEERLVALDESGLMDSAPEERFDDIVQSVAREIGVPVALISLVDGERQFFKSQVGLAEPWATERETPLSHSFCQHVVSASQPLIVEDARSHPVVQDNLAIRDLGVIAYAGVPVLSPDGHALGSLCAIDTKPRVWTAEDVRLLQETARRVEREIADPSSAPHAVTEPDSELAAFARRFLENRAGDAERIGAWLANGSWDEIARAGHQIKGTAGTFGYPELGTIASELEAAARARDAEVVAERGEALRRGIAARLAESREA